MSDVVVIGAGGIGYYLTPPLCRFLEYTKDFEGGLFLVDPDKIEVKNMARQYGPDSVGKYKTDALRELILATVGPQKVQVTSVPQAASPKTIRELKRWFLKDGVTIFVGVDNHPTRVFLQEEAKKMHDVFLIVGGNDYDSGQVQLYKKVAGKELLPPYTSVHPEMLSAKGRFPDDVSCTDAAVSEPQLLFANLLVATAMLSAYYTWSGEKTIPVNEIFLKVQGLLVDPVFNPPTAG